MASRNPGFNIPLRDNPSTGWRRQQHQELRLRGSIASQPAPVAEPSEAPGRCAHHWKIEEPNGTFSAGVCKRCGAEKSFRNYDEMALGGAEDFARRAD